MQFTGRITEIRPVKTGEGNSNPWASVEFEVTESNPQNETYPQIGLFDLFKNGDYIDFALKFNEHHKLGDEVTVHFNLKKSVYQKKDGSGEASFYKTSGWKIDKVEGGENHQPVEVEDDSSDFPF